MKFGVNTWKRDKYYQLKEITKSNNNHKIYNCRKHDLSENIFNISVKKSSSKTKKWEFYKIIYTIPYQQKYCAQFLSDMWDLLTMKIPTMWGIENEKTMWVMKKPLPSLKVILIATLFKRVI